MANICDTGENLDFEKQEVSEINDKPINPHSYGTAEWTKVEEQNIKQDSAKRLERMKKLHAKMDDIWKRSYLETEKDMNLFLPMDKNDKKKSSCAPPKLGKNPLNKYCDVVKYKQCVVKLTEKAFEDKEEKEKEKKK